MKMNKITMVSIAINAILAISLMIVLVNNSYPFLQMTPDGGGGGGVSVKIEISTEKWVTKTYPSPYNMSTFGGGKVRINGIDYRQTSVSAYPYVYYSSGMTLSITIVPDATYHISTDTFILTEFVENFNSTIRRGLVYYKTMSSTIQHTVGQGLIAGQIPIGIFIMASFENPTHT